MDSKKSVFARIDTIDLVRGWLLFVIIIDHIARSVDVLTGQGVQWVSAAEGFFFISGLMIGFVRIRKLRDQPMIKTIQPILKRAVQLYLWSIGLTFLFTIIGHFFITNPGLKAGLWQNQPLGELIWQTLTLRYTYGWADFLSYYAAYMALAPVSVWLLRKNWWFVVLGLSALAWLFGRNIQTTWHILFFGGVVAGYYMPDIQSWWRTWKPGYKKVLTYSMVMFTAATLLLSFSLNTIVPLAPKEYSILGVSFESLHQLNSSLGSGFFNKYSLGIGRIALFLIWFSTLFIVVRRHEAKAKKYFGWLFTRLGTHSLAVYILHAFFVFFAFLFLPRIHVLVDILVNLIVVGAIWLMVRSKWAVKYLPR